MGQLFRGGGSSAFKGFIPTQGATKLVSPRKRAGGPPFGGDTTVYWDFTDGDLIDEIGGVELNFIRSSGNASYFDSGGVMQYAGIDEPRFDHDPDKRTPLGLLIERGTTNVQLNSDTPSLGQNVVDAVVDLNAGVAPDGTMTASRLNIDPGFGQPRASCGLRTVSAGTYLTQSVFVKADGASHMGLSMIASGNSWASIVVRLSDGVVTSQGVGTTDGDIRAVGSEYIGSGVYRVWFEAIASTSSSNNTPILFCCDEDTPTFNTVGRVEYTAIEGEDYLFWGMQVELNDAPSSYISTDSATVTRAQGRCFTTDVTWYNELASTFYCKASLISLTAGRPAEISNGTNDQSVALTKAIPPNESDGQVTINNVTNQFNYLAADQWVPNVSTKTAAAWAPNDAQAAVNGLPSPIDNVLAVPTGIARLDAGGSQTGGSALNGWVQQIAYANVRKDEDFLVALTKQ